MRSEDAIDSQGCTYGVLLRELLIRGGVDKRRSLPVGWTNLIEPVDTAGCEGTVGGVVEDAPDAGHAHPYTPGRQTFAAAVEVHVLPLWVTFAPSG